MTPLRIRLPQQTQPLPQPTQLNAWRLEAEEEETEDGTDEESVVR